MRRIFLLSPAKVTGKRAQHLLNPHAQFALARQLQREGLSLADIFTFASGLYFRGKIAYARAFTHEKTADVVRVITSNEGLVEPERLLKPIDLRALGTVDIHQENARYHEPLRRDALKLAQALSRDGSAVLLGSIATGKYREILLECFGERLLFPSDFVGRGDLSRGALLLRAARSGQELAYVPVLGANYRGKRAPRVGVR